MIEILKVYPKLVMHVHSHWMDIRGVVGMDGHEMLMRNTKTRCIIQILRRNQDKMFVGLETWLKRQQML